MKRILFITEFDNGSGFEEDKIVANFLKDSFDILIENIDTERFYKEHFDLVLIRNAWTSDYLNYDRYVKRKKVFMANVSNLGIKIYNSLDAKADRNGKNYILDLFKEGYPVIPSIDKIQDLAWLPKCDKYIIKPKNGSSSIGFKVLDKKDLLDLKPRGFIIQPKIDFLYEISFYYVDKKFVYCLIFKPSKIPDWPLPEVFEPSKEDFTFAKKFLGWNKITSGVQRIDAVRLKDGSLHLLEIEDDSPYLSLIEIPEKLKKKMLKLVELSIKNYVS